MVHQTYPWNSLFDHLKFPKHLINSKVGIFFVHNTFHHLFFQYRHYLSFLGSCKSCQVSVAFLIAKALGPHSNIVFLGLFYFLILFANYICLPDCSVLHFFLGLFGKYFLARFTLRCSHCVEWKTLPLPCIGVFSLISRDEDEDDGCGVWGTDSESLLRFSAFLLCSDSVSFKVPFICFRINVFFIFLFKFFPFFLSLP